MNNAAVLSVLIQAKGFEKVSAQLAQIERSGQQAEKSLGSLEGQNKRTADSTDKLEKRFSHLDNTVGDFNRTMTGLRNVVGLVKFPAMIAGAGAAASALGSLAASGVALGAALAPAAGALAAYPALALAAGQATGVLKLATNGLDKALSAAAKGGKDYQNALKELTPEQRAFVESLKPAIDQFKAIRKEAQAGLLPGLSTAVKDASGNIGVLKPIVRDTAAELGRLATKAGELVGSKGFGKDLQTVGANNVKIIGLLGGAALHLFNALRNVVVVAQPLVKWLTNLAASWAEGIDGATKLARANGTLAGFFAKTRDTISTLLSIAGNLAQAFWEIGKAAAPLGRQILADIDKLTAKFRDWTKSVEGKNTLAQYFKDAKEPLYAAAGLVGDLGAAILRLSKPSKQSTALFTQLRELVPVLENLVATTTASLGPALIQALVPVGQLLGDLAGTNGPLNQTVKLIGLLAAGLHSLFQSAPVLNQMTVFSIGLWGSWKALALVASPLLGLISALTVALIGNEAATASAGLANIRLRLSLLATAVAMLASQAAAIAATAAQWLLNAAMTAFPALAIIAAIILVIKYWDQIKAKLLEVWTWIKSNWPLLAAILAGPFGLAVLAIIKNIGTIKSTVLGGFNAMVTGVKAMAGTIAGLGSWTVNRIVEGIHNTTESLVGGGGWIINRVVEGAHNMIDTVAALGGWIKNRILDGLNNVKDGIIGLGGSIIDWIVDGLKAGANKIVDFLNSIIGVINKLPGVNIGKIDKFAQGGVIPGQKHGGPAGLAQGGAFGRTGGMVTAPITMMGEEAPRFPEYVIPTNPAYRKRAQGLLGQAAGVIGFASGGKFVSTSYGPPWGGIQGTGVTATGVDLRGNPSIFGVAVDPSILKLGSSYNIQPNPFNTSSAFKAFDTGGAIKGNRIDFYDWRGRDFQNAWGMRDVMVSLAGGGGGGVLGAIGGAIGKVGGLVGDLLNKGVGFILDQLPSTDSLPDWIKGLGKYALDGVTGWIKDKVGGILGSIGIGGGGETSTSGLVAQVTRAVNWARAHGWHGQVTSGFRSYGEQAALYARYLAGGPLAAKPGTSSHEKGQAVDVTDPAGFARALMGAPANSMLYNRLGAADPVHFSISGYKMGGLWPYVGAFANGGVVPQTGLAMVHRGETISPAGGATTIIEHHYHGPVLQDRDFITYLRNLDKSYGRQNGRPAFGG